MDTPNIRYSLRGRKDRVWLRKRFCERAGLNVRYRASQHIRFGFIAYKIEIPADFSVERAVQIARNIRSQRKLLRLGYVADGLLKHAGRKSFWERHRLARMMKAKAR